MVNRKPLTQTMRDNYRPTVPLQTQRRFINDLVASCRRKLDAARENGGHAEGANVQSLNYNYEIARAVADTLAAITYK